MAFANTGTNGSLAIKLWRGERMCLIGMDVTDPEDDFVGFAIEVKSPGSADYVTLKNRLNFDYNTPGGRASTASAIFRRPLRPSRSSAGSIFPMIQRMATIFIG